MELDTDQGREVSQMHSVGYCIKRAMPWLLVFILCGGIANPACAMASSRTPRSPGSPEDGRGLEDAKASQRARELIRGIDEKYARSDPMQADNLRSIYQADTEIRKLGLPALRELIRALLGRGKTAHFRKHAVIMLEGHPSVSLLRDEDWSELLGAIRDANIEPWCRIGIARLAILKWHRIPEEKRQEVKRLALPYIGTEDGSVAHAYVLVILRQFPNDPEVEAPALERLKSARDIDDRSSYVYLLGRIKSRKALPIIVDLLRSEPGIEVRIRRMN